MLLMKQLRRRQLNLRVVDAVFFMRTKAVNFETTLRAVRPLVEAEFRDIDTERISIVSAEYSTK